MSPLLELADRVEKLAGPDREVDASVAWAFGCFDHLSLGPHTTVSLHAFDHDYDRAIVHVIGQRGSRLIYDKEVPPFTASLDAAMSLVPERYCWLPEREDGSGPFTAYVGWMSTNATAATPALALTAAALRARAATEVD